MLKHILFKLMVLLFAILTECGGLSAQGKFNAGIMLGAGTSSLYGNSFGASKLHGHIGIPLNVRFNKDLELQTLALISSKGFSSSFYKPSVRLNLCYLDLVATLKYFPVKNIFIGGGIYTSRLLYSHYRYLAYSRDYYGEPEISGIVNKIDYGLNGSVGCQFNNGIGFEVSILYGVQDVFNSGISDTLIGYYGYPYVIPANSNGKNLVISTSFYYWIGKMRKEK